MADGDGLGEAAIAAASPASAPGLSPSLGWRERLRAGLAGTGASLWFVAGLGLLYALRVPLRLCENLAAGERPRAPRGRAAVRGRGLLKVSGAKAKGQRFPFTFSSSDTRSSKSAILGCSGPARPWREGGWEESRVMESQRGPSEGPARKRRPRERHVSYGRG